MRKHNSKIVAIGRGGASLARLGAAIGDVAGQRAHLAATLIDAQRSTLMKSARVAGAMHFIIKTLRQ